MKVSLSWLKKLVDSNIPYEELINLLPLRSISIKEVVGGSMELDMKGYNRADLLSMRGVAYEIAAITGSKTLFKESEEAEFIWNQEKLPDTKVTISNPEFAPFYCIAKIEGLQVGKSSPEWVKKLEESGIRSVDNVTDVTNLVMLEYGQPLHAFDADRIHNEEIIVRVAKKGEALTTLDGKKRKLTDNDLLITDPKKPIGIAGVMGGENSEVTQSTQTILLEAAIFDPVNLRRTATELGLPSEAAKRFQHGLTKKRLLQALSAALRMYEVMGGKLVAITLVGNFEDEVKKVNLTREKLKLVVGIEFDDMKVEEYLKKLHFEIKKKESGWEVTPPYFRLDIEIEEDVIEEVARMYGYEKIPSKEVLGVEPLQNEDPIFKKIQDLKNKLMNLGLTEVQTYSFYSTAVLEAFGFMNSMKDALVKIANPISSETEYLRQSIWPNLVEVVGRNLRQRYQDIAIFEIGKAYEVDESGNPTENYSLSIALCNGSDNPVSELYQIAHEITNTLGVNLIHPPGDRTLNLYHPKRSLVIEKDDKQIGDLSEVHLRVLNKLGIEKRVAVLEISITAQL